MDFPFGRRDLLRVCAVSYLNTVPLVWGMTEGSLRERFALRFALPAECAARLGAAKADVGLIPAVELLHLEVDALPGVGIACHGPVRSILLVSSVPPDRIQTLAVDKGSRTSVMLARLLLAQRYGARPRTLPRRPELGSMLRAADAALIIGDPALHLDPDRLGYYVRDLGQEWLEFSGLPMVFAVWAVRRAVRHSGLEESLVASYREGQQALDQIVQRESERRGIPRALADSYLRHTIRYAIGPSELAGLQHFLSLAREWENQEKQEGEST